MLVDGTDFTRLKGADLRRRRRDLQLMFQDPFSSLDPRMRVGTIVREPLVVQGIGSPSRAARAVAALLREVGFRLTPSSCTHTSFPAANASGSAWPGRWLSIPG